jgi:hypothetical protein
MLCLPFFFLFDLQISQVQISTIHPRGDRRSEYGLNSL